MKIKSKVESRKSKAGKIFLVSCILSLLAIHPSHSAQTTTNKKITQPPVKTTTSHGVSLLGTALKYPANFKHLDYVNPKAPKGGTLKLHATGTYDNLHPYILKGRKGASSTLPFETLMTGTADEVDIYYGLIAKTIELPDDRSWVTYTLRTQAKWHDGSPITVDDVLFSYNILKAEGSPSYRSVLKKIVSVDILGKNKIRFTFTKKAAANRDILAVPSFMPILSKAYYSKHEFNKTTLLPPLGSGPYRITNVKAGHSITYSRVKDYWAKDLPINRGHYNFDTIQIDYYRDGNVAFEAFKSGNIDIRQENTSRRWATEYDFPAAKKKQVILKRIDHKKPAGLQAIYFNLRKDKFKDINVRKALVLAFDFEWLNKNQFFGVYQRTSSAFENTDMAAHSMPSAAESALLKPHAKQLPKEVFTQPFSLPVHDGSGRIRSTLAQASRLLSNAGWKVNPAGKRANAKGELLTIEFLLYNQSFKRMYQPYIQNLRRLGVDASIRIVDRTQFQKRRESSDFDMLSLRIGGSKMPGIEQQYRWGSRVADMKGTPNIAGVKNPAIDALLDQLVAARTKDKIVTVARAIDRILMWNYYFIPAWHNANYNIAYWDKFAYPKTEKAPYATMVGSIPQSPIGIAHVWWKK